MTEAFKTAAAETPADRVKRLVVQHQEYARKLCRQLAHQLNLEDRGKTEIDELMALANLGLVEAAASFDDTKGAAFTTFAYYRVRGAVLDGLRKERSPEPPAVRAEARRRAAEDAALAETAAEHEARTDAGAPDDAEEAARTLREAMSRLSVVHSLEAARESGHDVADDTEEAGEQASHNEQLQRLREAVLSLEPEEQELLKMMYEQDRSLGEIGAEVGRNKSTLSRRHAKILDRLRAALDGP